ncbi:MAG: hypothetical protein WC159_13295 [Sphaerochaetaceae bacterium]|jgi:hypothetical protein
MNSEEIQKIVEVIEDSNLSTFEVIRLIKNSGQSKSLVNVAEEIKLVIDYNQTIGQAITRGNYKWRNVDITVKNFPTSREVIGRKVEAFTKLFYFGYNISSEDVISKMDKDGYRPAMLMELLVLGFLFPGLQRRHSIVALGSIWQDAEGHPFAPCLDTYNSERGLELYASALNWRGYCFLGVLKSPAILAA